jgi:putative FmdB family regulatory protein
MPIYEYVCRECGHQFEHLARRLNEAAPACPECGTKRPVKQFSTFAAAVAGPKAPPCSSGACEESACRSGQCAGGACPLM